MPRSRSLISGMVSTHGLTNDSMVLLDAMDVQDRCIVHGEEEQLSQQQHFEILARLYPFLIFENTTPGREAADDCRQETLRGG